MAKRKIVYALVKLSVAKHVTAAAARKELKERVNHSSFVGGGPQDGDVRVSSAIALHGLMSPDDTAAAKAHDAMREQAGRMSDAAAEEMLKRVKVGTYQDGKMFVQPSQYTTGMHGRKLPITDADFVARCQAYCGCKNRIGLDCDCVSIGNRVAGELWGEYNEKGKL